MDWKIDLTQQQIDAVSELTIEIKKHYGGLAYHALEFYVGIQEVKEYLKQARNYTAWCKEELKMSTERVDNLCKYWEVVNLTDNEILKQSSPTALAKISSLPQYIEQAEQLVNETGAPLTVNQAREIVSVPVKKKPKAKPSVSDSIHQLAKSLEDKTKAEKVELVRELMDALGLSTDDIEQLELVA
jgi:hypothetical protein